MIFSFRMLHTLVTVIVPLPSRLELIDTAMKRLVFQNFLKIYFKVTLVVLPDCSIVFVQKLPRAFMLFHWVIFKI